MSGDRHDHDEARGVRPRAGGDKTRGAHTRRRRTASTVAMKGASLMLALGGCSDGGGGTASASGTCADPAGLYDYVFSNAQTNDPPYCPLPRDFAQVLPSNSATPFGCDISASNTAHNVCSASVEVQCPATTFDGQNGVATSIVTVDTNANASVTRGHVQMKLVYANGQGSCAASWDFTATRVHQ
jgi:hypothetical protein